MCASQKYLQNFERAWKKIVCIVVDNFIKSVSFNYRKNIYKILQGLGKSQFALYLTILWNL